ncbi:MAG: hypothetical protein L0H73_08680 [Nitrococcus sp.]|nr:hypothetical protein [Nitrococcus sp.]
MAVNDSAGSDKPPPKVVHGGGTDQRALTLTVYQNGLGLVHDVRWVSLPPAGIELTLSDLPARLQPDTLAVSLEADAHVLQQRFHSGDWTPMTLLQAYQGSEVLLVPRAAEGGPARRGILVSAGGGNPIVRVGERLEIGGPDAPWRIVFPPNPDVDVNGPSLDLRLSSAVSGRHRLDLIYLADGLDWQMDYWGELQGNELRLEGFARISNHSGGDYTDAKLRLIAGDVARSEVARPLMMKAQPAFAADAGASEPAMTWHLYRLDQPVSLPEAAAVRLQLLQTEHLAVRRYYRVNGNATDNGGEAPVEVRLHVDTASAKQPIALPAGTVRIRELNPAGEPRFLGADQIDHTPVGKPLELVLGTAFDVTAKRTRDLFQRLGEDHYEVGWRIELHNAGAQPVTVEVREYLPGDWKIVRESTPHERLSSAAVQWSVKVPASGAAAVSYQARYVR